LTGQSVLAAQWKQTGGEKGKSIRGGGYVILRGWAGTVGDPGPHDTVFVKCIRCVEKMALRNVFFLSLRRRKKPPWVVETSPSAWQSQAEQLARKK